MKVFDRSARYRVAPVTAVQVGIASVLWAVLGTASLMPGSVDGYLRAAKTAVT